MAKVSIVMCAYNSEKYIAESIESILNQTFADFEFIIINDASTDKTEEIIKTYQSKDSRVKLLQNKYKKGISGAANTGLDAAQGEFIARMDSDDISLPTRLEAQIKFLESHPEIGVCGAWVKLIGVDEDIVWENPTDPDYIKCIMIFYGAISNPVVMFRRNILESNQLRYMDTAAEDYEMYVRLSRVTKLTNIPKVLLHYRMHQTNFGKVNRQIQNESANYIRLNQIQELGIVATPQEESIHTNIGFWNIKQDSNFLKLADLWFKKLITANLKKGIFPEPTFSNLMIEKWIDIYKASDYLGTKLVFKFIIRMMYPTASKRLRIKYTKNLIQIYIKKLLNKL